jgi:two-component system, chemotaxis family, CheB/CheR fusion protein
LAQLGGSLPTCRSLSVADGTVTVNWRTGARNNQRLLELVWKEGGGPRAGRPKAKTTGLGDALIDRVIGGAHVERKFQPAGLVCTIEVALPEAADDGALSEVL